MYRPYYDFDKPFEDLSDACFVNKNHVNEEYLDAPEIQCGQDVPRDPRGKLSSSAPEIDFKTEKIVPELYRHKFFSHLSVEEHRVWVEFLKGKQEHQTTSPKVLKTIRSIITKDMNLEKDKYQKFAKEYEYHFKVKMYDGAVGLSVIYAKWYMSQIREDLLKFPDCGYVVSQALPHVTASMSWPFDENVKISNIQLIDSFEGLKIGKEIKVDFEKIRHRFETYVFQHKQVKYTDEEIRTKLLELSRKTQKTHIYLPLESILFLVASDSGRDAPNLMKLRIKDDREKNTKEIFFDDPIPSTECGRHTFNLVVEKSLDVFVKQCRGNESNASLTEGIESENWNEKDHQINELAISNTVDIKDLGLIKWSLKSDENKEELNILTSLKIAPTYNNGEPSVACNFVKIEYKPFFGCEYFTKYELLRAWFSLRLLKDLCPVKYACFFRICGETFETEVKELLLLEQIECHLEHQHKINMRKLLNNLGKFLKMVIELPQNNYLLKYKRKFPNSIAICIPENGDSNIKSFRIHSIGKIVPSFCEFVTSNDFYLPIRDDLCNRRHIHYKVAPCLLTPTSSRHRQLPQHLSFFNDREKVLEKQKAKRQRRNSL